MSFFWNLVRSVMVGRNCFEPARIERPKADHITRARTSDELLSAGADVYSTPFGNVGQGEHYVVFMPDNPSWEDRAIAQHILDHQNPRIHPIFTQKDIGERVVTAINAPPGSDDWKTFLDEHGIPLPKDGEL